MTRSAPVGDQVVRVRDVSWLLLPLCCLAVAQAVPNIAKAQIPAKAIGQTKAAPAPHREWRPVVQGHLKNGLRYAILPRQGNEPGVGLLMRNEGGFIAERRTGERGLAHLIEHIVFRSPTRTAPDDLGRFPRIGLPLTFPAPTAATTSWRESNYFVATRSKQPADLDILLGLFREVAGELTFRPDAVDAERASVMREMADKQLGNDIYASYIASIAPGSPTDVIDAQNSDDVPTASVETIRSLYQRLYRPESMMVVVVGDVDAVQTEALIQKRFADWRGVGPVASRASIPTFRSDHIVPISHSDLRYGRNVAMMTVVAALPPSTSRAEQAEAMLMDMLAVRAVNSRLAITRVDYPAGKYGMFIENGEQGHRLLIVWDDFVPGQWRKAVASLKKTTCDLNTAGFSEMEWTTAKQGLIEELEQRTKDMTGAPNVELAKDLSHALADGRDLIPPDELLRHARARLPTLGLQEGMDWWRRQWRTSVEHIRVETPELARVKDPGTAIRAAANEGVQDLGCKVRPS